MVEHAAEPQHDDKELLALPTELPLPRQFGKYTLLRKMASGGMAELFLALHGTALAAPNRKEALPKPEFLAWHRAQVFRGQARD